jgi:hypothetical protein
MWDDRRLDASSGTTSSVGRSAKRFFETPLSKPKLRTAAETGVSQLYDVSA